MMVMITTIQTLNKMNLKDNRPYIKTEVLRFGFFVLLSILILGCKQEQKLTAQYIVERSIEAHGGMDNWNSIKSLQFQKEVILYEADGTIETETNQFQTFEFSPVLKGSFRNLNANRNKGFNLKNSSRFYLGVF